MTTVININTRQKYDIYIGRPSKWGNPYVVGRDGSRATVLLLYKRRLLKNPVLLSSLRELRGKVLGCYCHPQPCHGHILAQFVNFGIPGEYDFGLMDKYNIKGEYKNDKR